MDHQLSVQARVASLHSSTTHPEESAEREPALRRCGKTAAVWNAAPGTNVCRTSSLNSCTLVLDGIPLGGAWAQKAKSWAIWGLLGPAEIAPIFFAASPPLASY
jgi:hypothetical protein